jgi:hypothetical protein
MLNKIAKVLQINSMLSLTSDQLLPKHVKDLTSAFGINIPDVALQEVTGLINRNDEDELALWAAKPENLEVYRHLQSPEKNKVMIECNHCAGLALYSQDEVAVVNPHIICRHCGAISVINET